MSLLLLLGLAAQPADLSEDVRREVRRHECGEAAASSEILVCGRRRAGERYRLSQSDLIALDPNTAPASVARERAKWIEEGGSGTGSCTTVGPGGWTGCMQKGWRKQRQQHNGWFGS